MAMSVAFMFALHARISRMFAIQARSARSKVEKFSIRRFSKKDLSAPFCKLNRWVVFNGSVVSMSCRIVEKFSESGDRVPQRLNRNRAWVRNVAASDVSDRPGTNQRRCRHIRVLHLRCFHCLRQGRSKFHARKCSIGVSPAQYPCATFFSSMMQE